MYCVHRMMTPNMRKVPRKHGDKSQHTYMTPLLESLEKLRADRGAMAALRKSLILEQRQRCYRYLPRLGCSFNGERDILQFSILAHVWGHHPAHSDTAGNLGASMHKITGGDEDHPFNRRFERFIASDSLDELAGQIQGIVSLLHRASIPLDFDQLSNDLFWFSRNPDRVKREICGGFYVKGVAA
jgi:CRISPR type I-E-associated protein CasB/Cse2